MVRMNTAVIRLALPEISEAPAARRAVSAMRRASSVLDRALAMDPNAMVRVRAAAPGAVDLFYSTPLGCVVSQRVPGELVGEGAEGAVVMGHGLSHVLATYEPGMRELELGAPVVLQWTGALPPVQGFEVVDTVPAAEVREIHRQMAAENKEAGAPGGVARSLLDQELLTVASDTGEQRVALTGRLVAAIGGLGVAAKPGQEQMAPYDYIRVSSAASWLRIDGLFGTIFAPRPGGLARVPMPN